MGSRRLFASARLNGRSRKLAIFLTDRLHIEVALRSTAPRSFCVIRSCSFQKSAVANTNEDLTMLLERTADRSASTFEMTSSYFH